MSNNTNRLSLFKPLKMIKSAPIIFNEFEGYYLKSYRPFIIFYDDNEKCYYYLKSRSAYDEYGNCRFDVNKLDESNEVLIKGTSSKYSLLSKDSLIDCSQIFKIDANLLESIVDKQHIMYLQTNQLSQDNINSILEKIANNMFQVPPYLSIVEVDVDFVADDNTEIKTISKATSLYLHPDKFECAKQMFYYGQYSLPKNKTFNDFVLNDSKYKVCIEFCEMFLNKYFSEETLKNFVDLQKTYYSNQNNNDYQQQEKEKEDIKDRDRGGDGGMSM